MYQTPLLLEQELIRWKDVSHLGFNADKYFLKDFTRQLYLFCAQISESLSSPSLLRLFEVMAAHCHIFSMILIYQNYKADLAQLTQIFRSLLAQRSEISK